MPIVNRLFLLTQESDEHDTSHLIQLCAYVQCYQDTITILLGDSELSEDIAGLEGLVSTVVWEVHVLKAKHDTKLPTTAVYFILYFILVEEGDATTV